MIDVSIKMKTPSLANMSCHWTKKHKIRKLQKAIIKATLSGREKELPNSKTYLVKITRMGPRLLDHDNLVASQKHSTDAIAEFINPGLAPGRADGVGNITFVYHQEKGRLCSLRIEIA